MTLAAYIALFGWVPAVLVFFAVMPARRAATVAVIGAWLLLPPYAIPISYFPDFSKNTSATIGMILGTVFFGTNRIIAFRPRWFDLPMLAWCLCGVLTSLQNGLGLYDGLSDALRQTLYWGLPYLLGRLYFSDLESLRSFAIAMVIGGLAYVLPCLWEIRMSPQILGDVYGITSWQGTRLGGFRPHVFFKTGLELGMWMTATSLTGWWLWRCGVLKRIGSFPVGRLLLPILMGTTVFCRSTGALLLLALGMFVLWVSTRFKTRLLLGALVLVGPLYVGLRIPNLWSGKQMVELAKNYIDATRAQSLEYRFMCEELLVAKALEQPLFGWGGWDRSTVYFDNNYRDFNHRVPPDGVWIATFGVKGFVGLVLVYLALELPTMLFLWRFPPRLWSLPGVAPATIAATLLSLYMVDCLMNGFINIIYITLAGGLISITPAQLRIDSPKRNQDAREVALADQCKSIGRIAKAQGKMNEAQIAWQRALDILTKLSARHPGDRDLMVRWCECANDLAWLELNYPDQIFGSVADPLALAGQVVEKCPSGATYWNTLGVAHFRASDYRGAVAALEQSITLNDGGTDFDYIFLAMSHARLGQTQQAQRCFAQVSTHIGGQVPSHGELARFFNEARSVLAIDSESAITRACTVPAMLPRGKSAKTS